MKNNTNIFEQASRIKLRFETPKGLLSVEQLWDLPLKQGNTTLYSIAKELQTKLEKETKPTETLSFFKTTEAKDTVTELQFEIVKHIVTTKVAEAEESATAAERQTKKAQIAALIAKKKEESMENMSLEELEKLQASL